MPHRVGAQLPDGRWLPCRSDRRSSARYRSQEAERRSHRHRRQESGQFVDRYIIEVEKISVSRAAENSGQADGAFLHWIALGGIDRNPVSAPVISDGYVKIPNSLEGRQILEISARCAAKETKGGAISVARDNCGEDRAFN